MKIFTIVLIGLMSPFILFSQNLDIDGMGWFKNNPGGLLPSSAGTGLKISTENNVGGLFAYDHTTLQPLNMSLQKEGGLLGIGTQNPESLLHLYSTGTFGAGSRLIFGDDLLNGRTNAYIAEWGWQTQTNSDILELSGFNGIKFTTGSNSANTRMEITQGGDILVEGKIRGVSDPVNAQDASTKAYVDNLLVSFGISIGPSGIQGLLDAGFNPLEIINEGATATDFIGLNYAGGIIFYILGDGTGLVAAPTDQSTAAEWGCIYTSIGGTSAAVGTGQANTTAIVNGCPTAGIAARLCDDLVYGGYDDWFLPSKDELNLMWENLADSDGNNSNSGPSDPNNIGGFEVTFYWSSSEFNDFNAWGQYFSDGNQLNLNKNFDRVRAIRAF